MSLNKSLFLSFYSLASRFTFVSSNERERQRENTREAISTTDYVLTQKPFENIAVPRNGHDKKIFHEIITEPRSQWTARFRFFGAVRRLAARWAGHSVSIFTFARRLIENGVLQAGNSFIFNELAGKLTTARKLCYANFHMNLEKYVSVSGLSGIHKIISSRANGLVIEDMNDGRTRFVPLRGANFSPLATIQMYTDTEEGLIGLGDVFAKVKISLETTPLPAADAASPVLRAWFAEVLPEHDQDRVHIADIKKLVKWYRFMDAKGLIADAEAAAEKAAAAAAEAEKIAEPTAEKEAESAIADEQKAD